MRRLLLLTLLAAACAPVESENSQGRSNFGKSDDGGPPRWLRCALGPANSPDAFFAAHELRCDKGAPTAPLSFHSVSVELRGAQNYANGFVVDGESTTRGAYASNLPLQVVATAWLAAGDDDRIFEPLNSLTLRGTLRAGGDAIEMVQPFAVWALELTTDSVIVLRAQHTIDVSPLTLRDGSTSAAVDAQLVVRPGEWKTVLIPMPPAASELVLATNDGRSVGRLVFDGPGRFRIEAGSAHREEAPPPEMSPPTPSPTPSPTPEPMTPPAPVDPTPGCGGEAEPRCAGQSCDEHFVFDYNYQKCFACGSDGLRPCANNSCDPHTVFDYNHQKCFACGSDGKRACAGNTCDAGLRFDWNDGKCHAQ